MNSSLQMRCAARRAPVLLLFAILAASAQPAAAVSIAGSYAVQPSTAGVIGRCSACPDGTPAPYGMCGLCGLELAPQLQCNHDPTSHAVPLKLTGTIHRDAIRATARKTGELTKTIDPPGADPHTYGVRSSITFIAEGPLDYVYEIPFTLHFDLPGCIPPGGQTRLSNVRITWDGAPSLAGTHTFQFATGLYFWSDFPLDGLDDFAIGLTQYRDHLDWYGLFPTVPGGDSYRYPSSGTDRRDVTWLTDLADLGPFSGTLAGPPAGSNDRLVTGGAWVRDSSTEELSGNNVIDVRSAPAVFSPAWTATVDQIGLAAYVLEHLPTPQTAAVGLLADLVDVGFSLDTTAGLGIDRLDQVVIHDLQIGVSAQVPDFAEGATQITLQVPVSYEGWAESNFGFPASMWVTFDGPLFDAQNLFSVDAGTPFSASTHGLCSGPFVLFGVELMPRTCTLGSSDDEDFTRSVVLSVPVSVPEGFLRGPLEQPNSDGNLVPADTIPDVADNCPMTGNQDQANSDSDNMGDACDPDDDNDGIEDGPDDCPLARNPPDVDLDGDGTPDAQSDVDGDGVGDACDPDADGDGVPNAADVCPLVSDPNQEDTDGDLAGDACDPDIDDDGVQNATDKCPYAIDPAQRDNDLDGIGDACDPDDDGDGVPDASDVCEFVPNPGQEDLDGDRLGDACDPDDDDDSIGDTADDCPRAWNRDQADNDGDRAGDVCDPDDDDDGVVDTSDNCQFLANSGQENVDGDAQGDACDGDLDGDGWANEVDDCPSAPNSTQLDTDGDHQGDVCDPDDDADGFPDGLDNCPLRANADQGDLDGDGQGDPCDPDDDNDGVADVADDCPTVPNADQLDTDGDGAGNACDPDDDADGVLDVSDACPLAWTETDADGNGCSDLVADLPALLQRLGITSGVARSLAAKAGAAAKASPATASNVLDAFLAEVAAQRGKHIGEAEADLLVRFVAFARLSL